MSGNVFDNLQPILDVPSHGLGNRIIPEPAYKSQFEQHALTGKARTLVGDAQITADLSRPEEILSHKDIFADLTTYVEPNVDLDIEGGWEWNEVYWDQTNKSWNKGQHTHERFGYAQPIDPGYTVQAPVRVRLLIVRVTGGFYRAYIMTGISQLQYASHVEWYNADGTVFTDPQTDEGYPTYLKGWPVADLLGTALPTTPTDHVYILMNYSYDTTGVLRSDVPNGILLAPPATELVTTVCAYWTGMGQLYVNGLLMAGIMHPTIGAYIGVPRAVEDEPWM